MIKNTISTILVTLSLGAFSAMATSAAQVDHAGHKDAMKSGMHKEGMMANEPHHVLAMAYHQNLAVFAKALQQETAAAKPLNVAFARSAVAEMRRSFDQMKQHHQEHMQTMSSKMQDPEMQTKMKTMMPKMESHQAEFAMQLKSLEQEVEMSSPDAKKVATLATSINTHLLSMAKMHAGCAMKMKM